MACPVSSSSSMRFSCRGCASPRNMGRAGVFRHRKCPPPMHVAKSESDARLRARDGARFGSAVVVARAGPHESAETGGERREDGDGGVRDPARQSGDRHRHREKAEGYEASLALWRRGQYEAAAFSFETFLASAPSHSLGWISFSRLTMATKGFKEARRVLFRGLNKASSVGMILQALGLAELREGNDVAAVVLLEESVRYFGGSKAAADAEVRSPPAKGAIVASRDDADRARIEADASQDAGFGPGAPSSSSKRSMMRHRFERARVLRWKVVTDARTRAIHSLGPKCASRFRQVRSACRRRIANRTPQDV